MKTLQLLLPITVAIAALSGCSESPDIENSASIDAPTQSTESSASPNGTAGLLIDDFSDPKANSLGIDRVFIDDTTAGGRTTTQHSVENGVLNVKGDLLPARGQPAWSSVALPLNAQGLPEDASAYEGVRLIVRVNKGNLSLSANSTEITNFDFHASTVTPANDGEFHEVKIPFAKMKRAWSAQTKLDTSTLNGLSLVAFGLQQGSYDFDFDEVGFY